MVRTMSAQFSAGEWLSVMIRCRSAGSRNFARRVCPKLRKNCWSPVSPCAVGASLPPYAMR